MKSEEQNIMENSIMEELKERIIKLEKELEFEKEKSRRMMWIFGLVGGNAFIENKKENK
jgi:hypothetical protein